LLIGGGWIGAVCENACHFDNMHHRAGHPFADSKPVLKSHFFLMDWECFALDEQKEQLHNHVDLPMMCIRHVRREEVRRWVGSEVN
jgi:hypothetical protein